jgi:alkylated DNA repair dioxygenase AlkB
MENLLAEIPWRQETIELWGKSHLQPRLSSWHGDSSGHYTYSGIRLQPHPWTPTLCRIRQDVEAACGHAFNSVLLNLYRDEKDSVGWHSDNERELGDTPLIASLSLGETRVFKLRHKTRRTQPPVSIELTDGSLLLMAGHTQRYWRHAVEKERGAKGPRINLTFRTILHRRD